jgi:hypothetical protein
MLDLEARFWELCGRATRHDEQYSRKMADDSVSPGEAYREAQASERAMAEIIELVQANPEHRPTFVRCFSDLVLWRRPAPFLLVAFCMRRLRFPEIPELIRRDAEAHTGTAYYADHMNHWSTISHAYTDVVWECAECFEYYSHEVTGVRAAADQPSPPAGGEASRAIGGGIE